MSLPRFPSYKSLYSIQPPSILTCAFENHGGFEKVRKLILRRQTVLISDNTNNLI